MDEINLDLESIAKKCGLYDSEDIELIIRNIQALDESYERDNLVLIYNFLLNECKDPKILPEIIRCEDRIRDKSTLPILVDILLWKTTGNDDVNKDDFVNTRVMCAKAIANLKDTSAVNALLYCLNNKDEHYKVRFACADALGKIGDKYAVAPLIEVVKDESEKSLYIRESAASALGMLGDIRAVDPLVNILETKNGLIDKFTFLKERVLEALGKLRVGDNERVFNAVKNSLMDDSPQIRINAIEAIMDSDNPKAYETIKPCLKDRDDEVKRNALIALYNLAGREILDEVINSDEYGDFVKTEAVSLIDEYETDGDEEE
ncbi:HEAT repeat domain-containing protein [bacterium]|nr:HEAT repeat domain-containing protein [bacterium]